MDPDILGYTVFVQNLNISMATTVNVTELNYNFSGLPGEIPINPCHVYEFVFTALNVVGEGEKSDKVQTCFSGGTYVHISLVVLTNWRY